MKHKIISILTALTFYISLSGQEKTVISKGNVDEDDVSVYMSPWEYARMMHQTTSFAFKIIPKSYENVYGDFSLFVGAEKKIFSSLSINVTGYMHHHHPKWFFTDQGKTLGTELETRWFYGMNRRIRMKKSTSNLSGGYIGVGVEYSHYVGGDYSLDKEALFMKWGVQERFLNYFFANVGIKVEFQQSPHNEKLNFSAQTYVDLGLFLTNRKLILDKEKLCPVLKCYEKQSSLLKTNLFNLFSLSKNHSLIELYVTPTLDWEKKIGDLPLSVSLKLGLRSLSYWRDGNYSPGFWPRSTTSIGIQPRWYYNLQKRVLNGKTGQGLSANYIAPSITHEVNWQNTPVRRYIVGLEYGIQRLIGDHLFMDFNLGFRNKALDPDWVLRSNILVGYRF